MREVRVKYRGARHDAARGCSTQGAGNASAQAVEASPRKSARNLVVANAARFCGVAAGTNRCSNVAGGAWPESATSAIVAPIVSLPAQRASAFLIIGGSPRRAVDEQYTQFAERIAAQLAVAMALRRTFNDLARAAQVNDLVTRSISGHLSERMQAHYSTVNGGEHTSSSGDHCARGGR